MCAHLSAWGVERGEAQVGLVGHQVRSLHLQDGFIPGQRCQVSVAHHLVIEAGLKEPQEYDQDVLLKMSYSSCF